MESSHTSNTKLNMSLVILFWICNGKFLSLLPVCIWVLFMLILGSIFLRSFINLFLLSLWWIQDSKICFKEFWLNAQSAQQGIFLRIWSLLKYSPVGRIFWIYLNKVNLSLGLWNWIIFLQIRSQLELGYLNAIVRKKSEKRRLRYKHFVKKRFWDT